MATGVSTLHPAMSGIRRAEWQLMRDCMDGEGAVKARGAEYLACPSGFKTQSDGGVAAYEAYKARAQFPEMLAPSIAAMIGIIHGREIIPELPNGLAYLYEDADGEGLPLEAFHRRITRELLVIGGYAVLTDAPEGGGDPYLSGFSRDRLINWDTDFFVLDETRPARDGFVWKQIEQYRVLLLEPYGFVPYMYLPEEQAGEEIQVRARGGGLLPRIPFAVGNALDLSPRIEAPPLIGVARAALAMYQLSADYRHQLYMSGQETLVAIDGPVPAAVGAGVVHQMMGTPTNKPDLKYVSPTCSGIEAHERAMQMQREAAVMSGARLFENAVAQESGEAKKLRYASETATLISVAQSSCLLLERALKNAAMIAGLPEDDVVVPVPTDLMDRTMTPQDFAALFGVYDAGGMSWDTFFANGQKGGIFSPEDTAEGEARKLDAPNLQDNAVL